MQKYRAVLSKFQMYFNGIEVSTITAENILAFMSRFSDGTKQRTKRLASNLPGTFPESVQGSYWSC